VPKPPGWKDEIALVDYVSQAITDLLDDRGNIGKYGLAGWPFRQKIPPKVAAAWLAEAIEANLVKLDLPRGHPIESDAVDAAVEGGNYAPLAWLLNSRHPLNDLRMKPPLRTALAPSTYDLIADILSGRRERPKHRPRLTEFERRAINPIHDAADEVTVVRRMLRAWYPEQEPKQIYDRALSIVARRHKVKSETLNFHLKRPKSDRRRPTQHPKRARRS
jgi:hypothetical protein